MTFEDSFTDKSYGNISAWAKELRKKKQWLKRAKQDEIINSMNRQELICTAGFLLRRQIQQFFPKVMEEAALKSKIPLESCADLSKSGNESWDPEFLKALANVLAGETFSDYDATKKILEARQWLNYMKDETRPQRDMAVKLIFALKMNDATAAKFLISSDHNLFSVRNPFDYICNFCLTCEPCIPYAEACQMLSAFENDPPEQIPDAEESKPEPGMTQEMTNEISEIINDGNIPEQEQKKAKLLGYMKEKFAEFVRKVPKKNQGDKKNKDRLEMEYPSGFSFQNIEQLGRFTNYLIVLYPLLDSSGVKIVEKANGKKEEANFPTLDDLIKEMYYTQGITFRENRKLNLPERGSALNEFNKIPFNKDVVLRLKNLSDTLRAIMRAASYPANAQDLSRSTIMILAYFFITGYVYSEKGIDDIYSADKLLEKLREDETKAVNLNEKRLIEALLHAAEELDKVTDSDEPVKNYMAALNWILTCFHFTNFYPPFVLDRFIMLCLLTDPMDAAFRNNDDQSLRFFMQLVIDRNYRLHINKNKQK